MQEVWRLCSCADASTLLSSTAYPRAEVTSRINNADEQIAGLLIHADGFHQYDDRNHAGINEGTFTLVEGQSSYTFATAYLGFEQILIKDINGHWRTIEAVDRTQFTEVPIEEYYGTTSAFPLAYDWVTEDTIKFYPAPTSTQVTLASGGKIKFKRTASLFTVSTGTGDDAIVPGFASPWHVILAYMASIPYCIINRPELVNPYRAEIERMKKELLAHYGKRDSGVRPIMTNKEISYL